MHHWILKDTTSEPGLHIPKGVVAAVVAGAILVAAVVLVVLFFRTDWDGTPYQVTNSCSTPVYIDNGSDGLLLETAESVDIPGFGGDLDLQIGVPGEPMAAPQTFESSPIVISGVLCPE